MSNPKTKIWVINEKDNVGTVIGDDAAGGAEAPIVGGMQGSLKVTGPVPYGHKVALADLRAGSHVIKYGTAIGRLHADVAKGGHVHTQNLQSLRGRGDLA